MATLALRIISISSGVGSRTRMDALFITTPQWVNILAEWTIHHVAELTKADRRRCFWGDPEQLAEKAQR